MTTSATDVDLRAARRARLGRRVGVMVLSLVVLAGMAGLLGARTATVSATGGGFELEVSYPQISRGGLAGSWSVRVTRSGGFDAPIVLATTASYLDLFDHNVVTPQPVGARGRGELLEWTFHPPAGDVLQVDLDARIEPARQSGGDAVTVLLVEGRRMTSVEYRTVLFP